MQQNFDDRLLKILEKEVLKEKWKKKVRITGTIIKKRTTKKGSLMLTVKTRKSEYEIVVPQYKKELFELAKSINDGDIIKVIGDKQVGGIVFCDVIKKLDKDIEEQMKLSWNEIYYKISSKTTEKKKGQP